MTSPQGIREVLVVLMSRQQTECKNHEHAVLRYGGGIAFSALSALRHCNLFEPKHVAAKCNLAPLRAGVGNLGPGEPLSCRV